MKKWQKNDDHDHKWPLVVVKELANDDHDHVQMLGDFSLYLITAVRDWESRLTLLNIAKVLKFNNFTIQFLTIKCCCLKLMTSPKFSIDLNLSKLIKE